MEDKLFIILERVALALERLATANESCNFVDPAIVEMAQLQAKHLKSHLNEDEEPQREDG